MDLIIIKPLNIQLISLGIKTVLSHFWQQSVRVRGVFLCVCVHASGVKFPSFIEIFADIACHNQTNIQTHTPEARSQEVHGWSIEFK